MPQSARPLAALATIVTGVGLGVFALAPAAQADTTSVTFFYSGSEQSLSLPPGVAQVHVDAVGGRGGNSVSWSGTAVEPGGDGLTVSVEIPVNGATTLYVEVGGNGQDGDFGTDAAGGWNGGGAGKSNVGAGGGGASDVRTIPSGTSGSLASRLVVAGGGAGAAVGGPGGSHDSGGGTADPSCQTPGGPGGGATASQPGSGGSGAESAANGSPGTPGIGGDGGASPNAELGGGGGGGGYYGGGGGGGGTDCGGGGGGGSSFFASGATFPPPGPDFGDRTWITVSYVVPMKPLVTTTPASDITQTSATLNGVLTPETVTPPDSGALCQFRYGLTSTYDRTTLGGSCGAGVDQVYDWETVSGLTPGTTYHFQLVASNRHGFTYGNDMSFTTLPAPAPTATTSPATNVGQHVATLNGVVNPRGTATSYHFDYGKTATYGTSTPTQSAGSGGTNVKEHALLSGLLRHTTYHFRVVAVSGNGTTNGLDRTFHTG